MRAGVIPDNLEVYPSQHAGLTALAAIPLRKRGWSLLDLGLFAAGAVLIDADHYLTFVLRTGNWSLRAAHRWYCDRVPPIVRGRPKLHKPALLLDPYRPFHAPLLLAMCWLLVELIPPLRFLRPLAFGTLFHRALDYSVETLEYRPGIPTDVPE
jgi:hypothetical protein